MPELRRRAWGRVALTAALVAALGLTGTAAAGDPVSDDDVDEARAAVAGTAAQVAAIDLQLAEQSAALDQAWVAVAQAAEDYTGAIVARDAADAAADDAQRRAQAAAAAVEEARADLGAVALEAYRSGGALDSLGAMLSSDGYEDYVARSTAIDQMGDRADRAVQRVEAAEVVGATLADIADEALADADDAAQAAEDALQRAQELQAAAEAEVDRVAAEREVLVAQLAELRQTSLEIERARQAQLEAERQARADAAAQNGRPSSGGSGSGGPGSGSGGPTTPPAAGGSGGQPSTPPSTPPADPGTPTAPPSNPTPSDPYGLGTGSQRGSADQGAAAVAWALQQVGKAYVYGASGPDSFDCSGLTMRAWQNAGLSINRTSRDQYRSYYKVAYDQMRPGDLIAWGTNAADPGSVYHVAMYIGNGQMVEASRPGIPVRVTSIRWQSTMPYAARP